MARAQTHPGGLVTSIFGDGSYLMLNSELYSAAFAGVPYMAIVCDNEGFAVIHRLQTNQGADGFNNMLADSRGPGAGPGDPGSTSPPMRGDWGWRRRWRLRSRGVSDDLRAAYAQARAMALETQRPVVLSCRVHYSTWTESGAWWETGVPSYLSGHASYDDGKARQVRWL